MEQEVTESQWQERFDQFVIAHLADHNLTNKWLARQLAMSERNLYRMVIHHTGLSPNLYIRKLRMLQAKEFLESSKFETVKAVAKAVGFTKTEYFSKLFKREFGFTPVKILKKGISNNNENSKS